MIRLKVIYNIDNITGVQNKNMPIYFAIIDCSIQSILYMVKCSNDCLQ